MSDKFNVDKINPFADNPIGYVTTARTYFRDKGKLKEDFSDSVERWLTACQNQLNCGFSQDELTRLKYYFYTFKGLLAGRFLWQLGTSTVDKHGLTSLQNCAAVAVNEPIKPFTWGMDLLMLGCGVGFNIQREYVYEIPKILGKVKVEHVDTFDCDVVIPDNREGWVKLLRKTLEASFITGKGFTYTTKAIRPRGAKIEGFGGTASGPEVLIEGISEINKLLNNRAKKKLRSVDAGDICNLIGYIVVAGNVRRSAEVLIGDYDDEAFLTMKRWDLGPIPKWRSMSNNSVACDDTTKLPESFWAGYEGKGEPYGLANLKNCRTYGRIPEIKINNDIIGLNPCMEQVLEMFETCCLAEVILCNCESYDEALDVTKLIYRVCKHSLLLPCHSKDTEDVVHKNLRMGISPDGFMQYTEEQRSWMPRIAKSLEEYDKEYSLKLGVPTSASLFTVKPSGTLALVAGVSAGCHPAFAPYYIRRIRFAENSPVLQKCKEAGVPIEPQRNFDGSVDMNTYVASFPYKAPDNSVFVKDVTAISQLEVMKWLQANWSDNAVSCTVYYKKEELPGIRNWLNENYSSSLKGVSFLLHNDHGFHQAPLEEITENEYTLAEMSVDWTKLVGTVSGEEEIYGTECEGGACPIR